MLRLASRWKRDLAAASGGFSPSAAVSGGLWWHREQLSTYTQTQRLLGKIAVITGAASGIGKATAAEFIRHGARVFIADINRELGRQTAAELGPDATFVPCDVTDESQIAAVVDLAVSTHGRLDILHNNAGVVGSLAPSITALDLSDFDRIMSVNVRAAVAGVKHAARVMVPRRAGSILCTASISAVIGGAMPHDYTVSKAAVTGLVRSAAAELCGSGIRINCISPYAVMTPMAVDAMNQLYPGMGEDRIWETVYKTGELVGAKCEVDDVAKAAVFLASDEAKYVSGHNLVVDGGFSVFKRLPLPPLP